MRKLLQNFYHKVITTDKKGYNDWLVYLKVLIKDLCRDSNSYLGTQTTAEIFNCEINFKRFTNDAKL